MKKVYLIFAMALLVASCTNQNPKNNEVVDEQTQNDGFIESTQIVEQVAPDLAYFDLKGPVKTMVKYDTKFDFDENGTMILVNGLDLFDTEVARKLLDGEKMWEYTLYSRNEEGYISEVVYYEGYETNFWENGRVVRCESGAESMDWSSVYEYDEAGNLVGVVQTEDNFGEITVHNIVYVIQKRDQHGNWIERKAIDGSEEWEESRAITYYE